MAPPRRVFSESETDEMVNRYLAGESAHRIAPDFSCSSALVVRRLRERGVVVTRRAFSPSEVADVVTAYHAGESSCSIAKRYGVTHHAVCDALRREGVVIVKKSSARARLLSPAEESLLIERYQQGATSRHLAADLGVSKTVVLRTLRLAGVERRESFGPRHHDVDETAFDDAERSHVGSYYLGLLLADGCVACGKSPNCQDKPNRIQIALSGDDGEHLRGLRDFLKTTSPLVVRTPKPMTIKRLGLAVKGGPSTSLTISSTKLAARVAEYGIIPAKTCREVADPRLVGLASYWAGVVDGDGGLYWTTRPNKHRYPHLHLCGGSEILMQQFATFLAERIGGSPPRVRARLLEGFRPLYRVEVRGRSAVAAARLLYTGDWPMLPRKKAIADEVMAWVPLIGGPRNPGRPLLCSTPECGRDSRIKGLCNRCYCRARYAASAATRPRRRIAHLYPIGDRKLSLAQIAFEYGVSPGSLAAQFRTTQRRRQRSVEEAIVRCRLAAAGLIGSGFPTPEQRRLVAAALSAGVHPAPAGDAPPPVTE